MIELIDETDLAAPDCGARVIAQCDRRFASDKHFPGVGALQTACDMEERRLAGARSGDQRDRLSSPQAKIGAAQNFPAALRRKQRHESPAI